MAGKVANSVFGGVFGSRAYAAQAAVASKKVQQRESIAFPKQDAKSTTLPNGMTVYSVEHYLPISRVGVFFKAGPRFETPNKLGVSHALRNAAGFSAGKSSEFGITRNLEWVGSNLSASCDRENLIFELQCNRDHLDQGIHYLADISTHPQFLPWELKNLKGRMELDIGLFNNQPFSVLLEALHKAAYRGGLSNSIYSPSYMVGKHSQGMLLEYLNETCVTGRASIVGLGVDHSTLMDYVTRLFTLETGKGASEGVSKYQGGEVFVDAATDVTYAAVVAEGAGLKNPKEMISLALLQQLLGCGSHVKYSDSSATSKLGQAAAKATSNPFAVTSLNINYSDTGLFGFCLAGQPNDMDKLVKGVVASMREVSKKSPTAKDLALAKHKLKAQIHMAQEHQSSILVDVGTQLLANNQFTNANDLDKAIEGITSQDLVAVSSKIVKGRPAMAALGKLHNTPHLEDLL